MTRTDPHPPARREALIHAARHLVSEAGVDAGVLLEPQLAVEIASGLAHDVAVAIGRRTAAVATVDELVDALVEAVLEGAEPWREVLTLAGTAIERTEDFETWSAMLGPWLEAVEAAIVDAQRRGIVTRDVDPTATALVLRDVLDRTARSSLRFERPDYRAATAALLRAALRV